ncbi:hypothetical protein F5051DRAFT_447425 [Lentinula edodes]|nr:hypothetical protein F5051DRAFT_447425 [Lentinula edodes]
MASYKDLLAGLKDEPLESLHRSNVHKTTSLDARTHVSIQKYQNLLRTDESEYSQKVMAAGISSNLSRVDPSRSKSIDAMFEEFQAEVTKEAVNSMLSNKVSSGSPVVSNDSLESLLVPDAQGRLQFGDPKKRNKRTTRALVTVSGLTQAIRKLEEKIQHMSPSHNMTEIHETLCVVEDGSEVLRHPFCHFRRGHKGERDAGCIGSDY